MDDPGEGEALAVQFTDQAHPELHMSAKHIRFFTLNCYNVHAYFVYQSWDAFFQEFKLSVIVEES